MNTFEKVTRDNILEVLAGIAAADPDAPQGYQVNGRFYTFKQLAEALKGESDADAV